MEDRQGCDEGIALTSDRPVASVEHDEHCRERIANADGVRLYEQ